MQAKLSNKCYLSIRKIVGNVRKDELLVFPSILNVAQCLSALFSAAQRTMMSNKPCYLSNFSVRTACSLIELHVTCNNSK